MASTNQLIEKANSQIAGLNKTAGTSIKPLTPITPQSISEEVTPAQVVQPPQPSTNFQDTVAMPQAGNLAQQQEQRAEQVGADAAQTFEDYINATLQAPTQQTIEAQQYDKFGVDRLQAKVNEYDLQLVQEQKRLRREIEDITNKGGGLKMGAQAEINNAQRASIAYQADLGMVRAFAQNDYLAAKQVADRAVDAIVSQNDKYIGALKENYQRNQDLFTTEQQRAFQVKLADYERQQNFEISQIQTLQDTKLNAMQMLELNGVNDPALKEQIGLAKNVLDVVRIAGQAGVTDLLSREQLRAQVANSWASYDLNRLKLDNEKKAAERLQQQLESGALVLDSEQKDFAMKLSKEYENESGEFKKQVGAYNRIIASAEDPSAAGDLALIFNYMKMLDPGSTVREGEFANAQNSAGVPERVISQYNSIISGERLSESTRDDFVDRSDKIYQASLDQQIDLESRFRDKAVSLYGLPDNAADLVIQDIRATGAVSETAFKMKFDKLSTDQLAELAAEGLLGQ